MVEFIEIDGSFGEGGGQILRTSASLATIFRKPVRITNIRVKRKEKGLRPQHLQSLLTTAKLCGGTVKGAAVGSTEIEYTPGRILSEYRDQVDTGTAGSISLIAQTIIPVSIFGKVNLDLKILGGTEVPHSPTVDYLDKIVFPVYRKLGASVRLDIEQRGYYPRGGGRVRLRCSPPTQSKPLALGPIDNKAKFNNVGLLSVSRSLPSHVSQRQSQAAIARLASAGIVDVTQTFDNVGRSFSPGSSLLIYMVSESTLIGASSLGERGKRAEVVGEDAAQNFLHESMSAPNADSHLADMLLTLLCCVEGKSSFRTSLLTEHFMTNAEIARKITNCNLEYHKDGPLWFVELNGSSEKPN